MITPTAASSEEIFGENTKKGKEKAGTNSPAAAKAKLESVVKQVTPQLESKKGSGEKLNTIQLLIR